MCSAQYKKKYCLDKMANQNLIWLAVLKIGWSFLNLQLNAMHTVWHEETRGSGTLWEHALDN